jgi:hypothetical protein
MGWSRGGVGAPSPRAQGESAKGKIAVNAAIPAADLSVDAIPADQIQVQLERTVASDAFDASRRNRAFLRFVVEETLAERADRIKAYTIATSVLGRDEAFDSQSDPMKQQRYLE